MKKFDSKEGRAFVALWADISAREGDVDRDKAEWAAKVMSWIGSREAFLSFCFRVLGLHSPTARSLAERAEALGGVPDERVWQAVRWPGVMHLARIADTKKRERVCRVLVAEREAGKHVSDQRLMVILREQAPDVFAPTPPVPETKKDREQERAAQAVRTGEAVAPARTAPAVDFSPLAATVRRLVKKFGPLVAQELTPAERKLAGLDKRASA